MITSERQTIRSLVTTAFTMVLAVLVPATQATSQDAPRGDRVAKQDLPTPEFEELVTPPSGGSINSSPITAPQTVEGSVIPSPNVTVPGEIIPGEVVHEGAVPGSPSPWVDEGIGLGSEFAAADGSWLHEMPQLLSSGTWLWRGHWYTEQAVVAMYRTPPNGKILTRDPTFTRIIIALGQSPTLQFRDNQDPLQTDGQTFRAETGVKLTIGNIIGRDKNNRDHAIEFSFLGFFDFVGRDTITATEGPGTDDPDSNVRDLGNNFFLLDGLLLDEEVGPTSGIFRLPISIVGFSNARTHAYLYEADFNSYELNLRKRSRLRRDRVLLQPNGSWNRDISSGRIFTLLGGLRLLRHNERLLWTSEGAIDGTALPFAPSNTASGEFESKVHNDMFGLQFGTGIQEQKAHWNWGIKTTAGILYNFADRKIRIETNDPTAVIPLRQLGDDASDDQAVFLGEAGAHVGYHVRPNVTLKVSYDVLYYTGIAVARDGVEINGEGFSQDPMVVGFRPGRVANTFRPLELRNDALYHALSFGFEIVW